jgi:uncharacterized membrane protein (UPF0127 family)
VWVGQAITVGGTAPPRNNLGPDTAVTSSARGIYIDFGQLVGDKVSTTLSIGSVTQTARATANGRPGTASTGVDVQIDRVVITRPSQSDPSKSETHEICPGLCADNETAVAQINQAFPTLLNVSLPRAETPFGTDSTTGYPLGSPGGYQAIVEATLDQQYSDLQFNGMRPEEAIFKPGMRVALYNDGKYGLNREILDLAGVHVDATLGWKRIPAGTAATFTPGTEPGLETVAGDPGIAGSEGFLGQVLNGHHFRAAKRLASPLLDGIGIKVLEDFFNGFGFTLRKLAEGLTMFAFLMVLGLPLLLMARRHLWVSDRAARAGAACPSVMRDVPVPTTRSELGGWVGVCLLVLALGGCSLLPWQERVSARGIPMGDLRIEGPDGSALEVTVEIADSTETRSLGLQYVESLDDRSGMAFLFPRQTLSPFWMKDTQVPLDIAFWDEGGAVVEMMQMDPCRSDPCPTYTSVAKYVGSVEVRRGLLKQSGVRLGNRVELRRR